MATAGCGASRSTWDFSPKGTKPREGDGRTPEGTYFIDRKNPASQFYLSLGISYPNSEDRRLADERGVDPGGDIFIHGQPTDCAPSQDRRLDGWLHCGLEPGNVDDLRIG